ncbi:YhjD/YihY/BrkB family envelope integrity protein [Halorubellus sp. PRR65]|uniref:YhjD/YihY/BrkB family envelope integrity protein n=1 Tax=Halorubellus sp. PRR65 TaxID=3098148 RepID=UPI002B2619B3|nr:YhjD/YihY/BrkB family envelope integrity protein [Halorubellus sp. PRR65]
MPRIRRTVDVGRATVSLAQSEQITFLAAAIAYYAFASIVPLFVLTAVVASVVGGDALATDLVEFLGSTLTPASQDVLLSTLTTTTGRGSATLVGVVALAWSSLKVFRALDTAFSIVYGTEETPGFLEAVVDGVVAFGAVALAIGVSVGVVAALTVVDLPFLDEVGFVIEVFVLAAAFYPLYYLFPGVEMTFREAVPGAVLAALGWTTLSGLFQLYAENAETLAVWGVLGAALVVVTWLYVGSLLLLVGATVNAVLADRPLPAVGSDDAAAVDRHLQSAGLRHTEPAMGDDDRDDSRDVGTTDEPQDDVDTGVTDEPRDGVEDADAAGDQQDGGDGGASAAASSTSGDEPDPEALREEIEELRQELEAFEDDVDDRTLHRDDIERDLKRYVRRRVRRGKARGWGPYLVLLYGTVMTLGAFYTEFLTDGWAIFAMIVIWLSTLGLYALMLLVGLGVNAVRVPGRLRDAIGDWRS